MICICILYQGIDIEILLETCSIGFVDILKFGIHGTYFSGDVLPTKFFEDAKFPFYTPDELVAMKNNNLSNIQYALEKALVHDNINPCAKPMIKDYCYTIDTMDTIDDN